MQQNQQAVEGIGRLPQRCPKHNKLATFKNIAKSVVNHLTLPANVDGRKWSAEDILTVLAYAWIRGVSVDHAAEKLNNWAFASLKRKKREYADGRYERLVPHQTTINAWLRQLSLTMAHALAKAVFEAAVRRFFLGGHRNLDVVLEFDLTYLGYWGKRRDKYIKGSKMVKGTRFIRHYHGAMIHGAGISLFVGLRHVAKGESKIPFMLAVAQDLQKMGLNIQFCAVDREYYRQGVLDGMKQLGIDVITPVKNYDQVKGKKADYLLGYKGRIQEFTLSQGAKKGRIAKKVKCWVILLPRGKQRLDRIKQDYRRGKRTIFEASDQIYGLITTRAPQYAGSRFPLLMKKIYKMRWQIETAFRDNELHKGIWRSNYDGTRFLGELGRFMVYNGWQEARHEDPRGDQLTFQMYRDELIDEMSQQLNL